MLTRLTDKIEKGADGETRIIRYGMWGTSAEIEKHGRKYVVIHKNKKQATFPTLAEAEVYCKEFMYK